MPAIAESRMTFRELSKNLALWFLACAILIVSAIEVWTVHSVAGLCSGILAAALVLPPARKRMPRGIRDSLKPSASACFVIVLLAVQLAFFASGMILMGEAEETAHNQHLREVTAARRQALADAFNANKPAILAAIDDQVRAGNLAAALAASNKYDIADADLNNLKLRIKASLAKVSLQNESSLTLAQRTAAYTQLAEFEPTNKQYADKAKTLSAQVAAENEAAAEKQVKHMQLLMQFSEYDGSHRNVEAAIKARMNNPDSYQHVKTNFTETPSGAIVYSEFRGTNAFGGIITTVAVATVDRDGNVTALQF